MRPVEQVAGRVGEFESHAEVDQATTGKDLGADVTAVTWGSMRTAVHAPHFGRRDPSTVCATGEWVRAQRRGAAAPMHLVSAGVLLRG